MAEQPELQGTLLGLNPFVPVGSAISSYNDWSDEFFNHMADFAANLGASSTHPTLAHQSIELSLLLIEHAKRFLLHPYRCISLKLGFFVGPMDPYEGELDRLIPTVQRDIATLLDESHDPSARKVVCDLVSRIAVLRHHHLNEESIYALLPIITSLLARGIDEGRQRLAASYAEVLRDACDPVHLKGFMERDLVRPVISTILGETEYWRKSDSFPIPWPSSVPLTLTISAPSPSGTVLSKPSLKASSLLCPRPGLVAPYGSFSPSSKMILLCATCTPTEAATTSFHRVPTSTTSRLRYGSRWCASTLPRQIIQLFRSWSSLNPPELLYTSDVNSFIKKPAVLLKTLAVALDRRNSSYKFQFSTSGGGLL